MRSSSALQLLGLESPNNSCQNLIIKFGQYKKLIKRTILKKLKTQVYPPPKHTHQKTEKVGISILPHNAVSAFFYSLFHRSVCNSCLCNFTYLVNNSVLVLLGAMSSLSIDMSMSSRV
jgi:hypothetical protein